MGNCNVYPLQSLASSEQLGAGVAVSCRRRGVADTAAGGSADHATNNARAITALGTLMRGVADIAIWALVLGWIPLVAFAFALLATRVRARRPAA